LSSYNYQRKDIQTYLEGQYTKGLMRTQYLDDHSIEKLVSNIGIFKLKGYAYAFKPNVNHHSIDDVLLLYFFDKYITKYLMDMSSAIETKLKSILIEQCYQRTQNPFFYLATKHHKNARFFINKETEKNWKNAQHAINSGESYSHYGLYYRQKYGFLFNQRRYLNGETLIQINSNINYPPFHYLIESATLGVVIHFIKSLKIGNFDLLKNIAHSFGIANPSTFEPYLERLNEIRNRAAHRERLFNRSYRSVIGVGSFHTLRTSVSDHKLVDVYMFLFFLLGKLDSFSSYAEFETTEIERIFRGFKSDSFMRNESNRLTKKVKRKQMEQIKKFILRGMK